MDEIIIAIGKRIREIRTAQGISLEELSFKSQLNAAHLGQIERGLRNPTILTLEKVAAALEVPFYDILGETPPATLKPEETNVVKQKINAQLSSMTLDEQKDILRIIRILRRYTLPENETTD